MTDPSMLERILPVAVVLLTVSSWVSVGDLVRAAVKKPRIGALTERAGIGVLIAVFGTVSAFLIINTEADRAFLPSEVARITFRMCLLVLLAVPSWWNFLYRTGRLGGVETCPNCGYRIVP